MSLDSLYFSYYRIYRGYSLLPSITDVTMENNLSRVVAAVSHGLITSTTRALTVSFLLGLRETALHAFYGQSRTVLCEGPFPGVLEKEIFFFQQTPK